MKISLQDNRKRAETGVERAKNQDKMKTRERMRTDERRRT